LTGVALDGPLQATKERREQAADLSAGYGRVDDDDSVSLRVEPNSCSPASASPNTSPGCTPTPSRPSSGSEQSGGEGELLANRH
jgi:hypothetical protein